MQKCQNKSNNIKHIPTNLNYFTALYKRFQKLKQQQTTIKLFLILLIIWNLILSYQLSTKDENIILPPYMTNLEIMED